MRILIDTRIWGLALKAPYYADADPVKDVAAKAEMFVRLSAKEHTVCLSTQLVAEIYHVLTARGKKLAKRKAGVLVNDLVRSPKVVYKSVGISAVQQALMLSAQTGVHIWDFLVVLPFQDELDKIYTMDPHFKNCKALQIADVENPMGIWTVEGRKEP